MTKNPLIWCQKTEPLRCCVLWCCVLSTTQCISRSTAGDNGDNGEFWRTSWNFNHHLFQPIESLQLSKQEAHLTWFSPFFVLFTLHSLCLPHGLGCAGGTCIGGAVDSIGQEWRLIYISYHIIISYNASNAIAYIFAETLAVRPKAAYPIPMWTANHPTSL